jgi:methylated-DNA-protein-cysteine methyltransferase related protein
VRICGGRSSRVLKLGEIPWMLRRPRDAREDLRNRRAAPVGEPALGSDETEGGAMGILNRFRRVIAHIPRGKVMTYGSVAAAAGYPRAARVTVRALYGGSGLPWHRVVAAGGRIALPGEDGREQRLRLELEGVRFHGGRVRMDLHSWTPRKSPRSLPSRRSRPARGATAHRSRPPSTSSHPRQCSAL